MKSMTGFGRGVALGTGGTQCIVEISAVNSRKQLEMRLSIPKELCMLEGEIRSQIQKNLVRGTLSVSLAFTLGADDASIAPPINFKLASRLLQEMRNFANENKLPEPTLADVMTLPGVIKTDNSVLETMRPLAAQALNTALEELNAMRIREGIALQQELSQRGRNMSVLLERIAAREHEAILLQQDRIRARIAALGVQLPIDDERLAKEVAFYVDKSDITEEIVRLRSHLQQYDKLMVTENDAGRNLDFLCQEMSREANTLSAKTADLPISADAMELKIELSKIKEQVMNVE